MKGLFKISAVFLASILVACATPSAPTLSEAKYSGKDTEKPKVREVIYANQGEDHQISLLKSTAVPLSRVPIFDFEPPAWVIVEKDIRAYIDQRIEIDPHSNKVIKVNIKKANFYSQKDILDEMPLGFLAGMALMVIDEHTYGIEIEVTLKLEVDQKGTRAFIYAEDHVIQSGVIYSKERLHEIYFELVDLYREDMANEFDEQFTKPNL